MKSSHQPYVRTHLHLHRTNLENTKPQTSSNKKNPSLKQKLRNLLHADGNTSRDQLSIVNNLCGPGERPISGGSHCWIQAYCCCQAKTRALGCSTFPFFRSNPDFYGKPPRRQEFRSTLPPPSAYNSAWHTVSSQDTLVDGMNAKCPNF